MMNRILIILVLIVPIAIIDSFACPPDAGVKISIQNVANGKSLKLNNTQYVNANGDKFIVSMYKYYISNIKLIKANGDVYIEGNSYHLVNESKSRTKEITLNDVPAGYYTAISFMIGVDSLHNVSGAQSGDLDPINAMFWDWNTGYIMAKLEGYSPDEQSGNRIEFHIGGFSGQNSVLRNVTLKLPGKGINLGKQKTPVIHLQSDVAEWFKSPEKVDFSKSPVITMDGPEAAAIADNYSNMFTVKSLEQ